MIRAITEKETVIGPHVDQSARDVLDDLGLVPTYGTAVATSPIGRR